MYNELNVRLEFSIDGDKIVSTTALAEFVTEQNVESILIKTLVESLNILFASRRSVTKNTTRK
jgi:hypothetical protein